MIIVSGRLYLHPGTIQKFLAASMEAVAQARRSPGCRDLVVAADPLEPDRVNVYEEWESEEDLLKFRGEGPDSDMVQHRPGQRLQAFGFVKRSRVGHLSVPAGNLE